MKKWLEENKKYLPAVIDIAAVVVVVIVIIISVVSIHRANEDKGTETYTDITEDAEIEEIDDVTVSIEEVVEAIEVGAEAGLDTEAETEVEKYFYESRLPEEEDYAYLLTNRENVYFDNYVNVTNYDMESYFKSGEAYLLNDLEDVILEDEFYGDTDGDLSISYAYMDLGNDGEKELAVRFSDLPWETIYDVTYIIKPIDGKLEVVYIYSEGFERGGYEINYYGYWWYYYNCNGAVHDCQKGLIDGEGKANFLYGYYNIDGLEEGTADFCCEGLAEAAVDSNIEDEVLTEAWYFDEQYNHEDVLRTFYIYDRSIGDYLDQSVTLNDSKYTSIYEKAGLAIVSEEEIEARCTQIEAAVGANDEIIDGPALEFIDIYK